MTGTSHVSGSNSALSAEVAAIATGAAAAGAGLGAAAAGATAAGAAAGFAASAGAGAGVGATAATAAPLAAASVPVATAPVATAPVAGACLRKRDGGSSENVSSGCNFLARASSTPSLSTLAGSGMQQSTGHTAAHASWSKKPTHSVHFDGTMK
jgi:hypothetical protein